MTTQVFPSRAPGVSGARPVAVPQRVTTALRAFALLTAVVCLYSMRRADPDLWGYLASGRLFVEGGLTTHDPFAYTSAGFEWVTFEYGADVVLWLAYKCAGPVGLIALKCLVGGIALSCLAAAVHAATDDPHVEVPVFVLCASAVSRFFLFRPQLFTFAFLAVFVVVLFRYLVRGRASLWALPVVMLVWTNMHGGFVAGLGAIGLAIVLRMSRNLPPDRLSPAGLLEGTRALWATLAACVAVTFINPMGVRLWIYVWTELTHGTNRRYTVEWGPASLHTDAWSALALTLVAVVFLAVSWFACRQARTSELARRLCWVLSGVPLLAMSFVSIRHVPIAAIWLAPTIAWLASRAIDAASFRRIWLALRGLSVLPACLTMAFVLSEPQPVVRADAGVLGTRNPCQAVAFMKASGLSGNVFAPLWWGSYVSWNLYPAIRISMDGRNISLFSDRMVSENFDYFLKDADSVDVDAPLRYDTDFLLIPTDSPALASVETDRRWRQGYRDAEAALFLRAGASSPASSPVPASSCSGLLQ
jgi:hypothetical protein